MIRFKIKSENEKRDFEIEETKTFIDLKKQIIETLGLNIKYIDLIVDLERPIRGSGKYTLEPGKLSRLMDTKKFTDFNNLNNRNLELAFVLVHDYEFKMPVFSRNDRKIFKKKRNQNNYNGTKEIKKKPEFKFNEDDFPKLC